MDRKGYILVIALLVLLAFSGAGAQSDGPHIQIIVDGVVVYEWIGSAPTETPQPTATNTPVPTPTATEIPPTAEPTATAIPTVIPVPTATPPQPSGIFIDRATITAAPESSLALIRDWAGQNITVDLSNQDSQSDVVAMSAAVLCVRGEQAMCDKATDYLQAVPETENGGRTLALGRNLLGYVVAADLIGHREAAFVDWLWDVRFEELDGRTLVSTHEGRPNNWGTHAGASRIAADLYLGDMVDLQRAAVVFEGYLGNRAAYAGFKYGSDLSWQADPDNPVGVNPAGATIQGYNVDGVLPDDQRRTGPFEWPAPEGNYPWGALQGAVAQAWMLDRVGIPAFSWEDQAVLRAARWLVEVADNPAEGDDVGATWGIYAAYGVDYRSGAEAPGKNAVGLLYPSALYAAAAGPDDHLAAVLGARTWQR